MPTDYKKVAEENREKYGTRSDQYIPLIFNKLYSDRTHFVYELLQNAEDAGAKWVEFRLYKDRLEFRHNGRLFNENDVRGICGLAEGTKKKDDYTQIGKFGIGFKSVYAYTTTPQIISGDEAFVIEKYLFPREIKKVKINKNETLFVFPFDNKKDVSPKSAFNEISKRLTNLDPKTILFLESIKKISWSIGRVQHSGSLTRNVEKLDKHIKMISLRIKKTDKNEGSEEWLVFERPIKTNKVCGPLLKIQVAFKFKREEANKKRGIKGRIVPIRISHLIVFFPTESETHLKFLIQGPFRTTPARDNIPKDDEWNKKLIWEISKLVADSIIEIKKFGLLTVDFLNILPLDENDFPKDHMYRPIFDAVLKKLRSSEELLPADDGGYVKASKAFLARGGALIDLLGEKQLARLFRRKKAKWLSADITRDKTPILREYLIEKLGVKEITPEKLVSKINKAFIKDQSDEWVIKFYKFLWEHESLRNSALLRKPFIRLENGSHVAPFSEDGKPQAYLPSESESLYPTVKRKIANDKEVKSFLKELGLKKPDEVTEIIEYILPKYTGREINVTDEENLLDVQKILNAIENASDEERKGLIEKLKEAHFLQAVNAKDGGKCWCTPRDIYLTSYYTGNKDVEIFFEGNPDTYFLDEIYDKEKVAQFLEIGCHGNIYVKYRRPDWDGNIPIKDWWGNHERGLDGFDPDCEVEGLEFALENITIERAIIIWKLLKKHHKTIYGVVQSCSRQDFSGPIDEEEKASKMGKLLRESKWLPDRHGSFKKPSQLFLSDLPDGFDRKSLEAREVAEKLGFKKDIEQEFLSSLSRKERERYQFLKTLTDEEIEFIKEYRRKRREEVSIKSVFEKEKGDEKEEVYSDEKIEEAKYIETEQRGTEKVERSDMEHKELLLEKFEDVFASDADEKVYKETKVGTRLEGLKKKQERLNKRINQEIEKEKKADLVRATLIESSKYTYAWFKALIENEILERENKYREKPEIDIYFKQVKRYSDNMLFLKFPSRIVPKYIEDLSGLPMHIYLKQSKHDFKVDVNQVRDDGVIVRVMNPHNLSRIDFNQNLEAKMSVKDLLFLLKELDRCFKNELSIFEERVCLACELFQKDIRFIFGPPGTGKTTELAKRIVTTLAHNNAKILILTPTNKAADVILRKLIDMVEELDEQNLQDIGISDKITIDFIKNELVNNYADYFVRFGSSVDKKLQARNLVKDGLQVAEKINDKSVVLATTIVRLPYERLGDEKVLKDVRWDYVVFDESSMIPLAYIVYAILYMKKENRRKNLKDTKNGLSSFFSVAGDPFQIQPIGETREWSFENIYTITSLKSFGKPLTLHPETGCNKTCNSLYVECLKRQYRSITPIGELFSRYTYDEQLKHDRDTEKPSFPLTISRLNFSPFTIVEFPVKEWNKIDSILRLEGSPYNIYSAILASELAFLIAEKIKQLGLYSKELAAKDDVYKRKPIGIISPYKAQANLTNRIVGFSPYSSYIEAATVHSFQGDENDVIIVVMNPPSLKPTNRSHINNKNIINVAVSRARDYLIMLMPKPIINQKEQELCKIYRLVKRIGSFSVVDSKNLEREFWGDRDYIHNHTFTTSHQVINAYSSFDEDRLRYEIRMNNESLDVVVYNQSEPHVGFE
jgi:flagellar biosynthesis GTPase FlhF